MVVDDPGVLSRVEREVHAKAQPGGVLKGLKHPL